MILEATHWLPPASQGVLEKQLLKLAETWIAQWVSADQLLEVERFENPGGLGLEWLGCPLATVGFSQHALLGLGELALDRRADVSNVGDLQILTDVGRQAVKDFAGRVCEIGHPEGQGIAMHAIRTEAEASAYRIRAMGCDIVVSLSELAQTRLRLKGSGHRRTPVLGKMAQAFAPEMVRLGCHLGSAFLLAWDVKALTKGDLVILDRQSTDALPLAVDGTTAPQGRAVIEPEDDRYAIRIIEPIRLSAGSN